MAIEMNFKRYKAYRRQDDFSSASLRVHELFVRMQTLKQKKELVLGHAVIHNPFNTPQLVSLNLEKPIKLLLAQRTHYIPQDKIAIDYYPYNLKDDKLG